MTRSLHCFVHRKITFPDCSAPLLTLFLQYLYGGSVDYWSITNEQLIELLVMADRFEVEQLSIGCQNVLASQLDSSNVVYMLAVADQCSASQLLVCGLTFNNDTSNNAYIVCRNRVSTTYGKMPI